MFSKRLSVLLIGLLYAHQTLAFPGNQYYVEAHGVNPHAHEHRFRGAWGNHQHPQYHFGMPPPPPDRQSIYGPFGAGQSYTPPSPPIAEPPYNRHQFDRGNFPPQPNYQGQSGWEFDQGQRPLPDQGYPLGQSGYSSTNNRPRYSHSFPQPTGPQTDYNQNMGNFYKPSPNPESKRPRPRPRPTPINELSEERSRTVQSRNQQPGWGTNTFQPHPDPGSEFQYQKPGEDQTGNTFQPRPVQSQNQQPGWGTNTFQPLPDPGSESQFQKPGEDQTGNTFQSLPVQSQIQQPDRQPTNTIQPQSVPGIGFQFPNPGDDQKKNTIQSRPDNSKSTFDFLKLGSYDDENENVWKSTEDIEQPNGKTTTTTTEKSKVDETTSIVVSANPTLGPTYDFRSGLIPTGDSPSGIDSTDDAINRIFNTKNYLLSNQNQGKTNRDPKSDGGDVHPVVNQRGLFITDPICTDGKVLRAGRCRSNA